MQTDLRPKQTVHRVSISGADIRTLEILAKHSLLGIPNVSLCALELEKDSDRFCTCAVEERIEDDHQ